MQGRRRRSAIARSQRQRGLGAAGVGRGQRPRSHGHVRRRAGRELVASGVRIEKGVPNGWDVQLSGNSRGEYRGSCSSRRSCDAYYPRRCAPRRSPASPTKPTPRASAGASHSRFPPREPSIPADPPLSMRWYRDGRPDANCPRHPPYPFGPISQREAPTATMTVLSVCSS